MQFALKVVNVKLTGIVQILENALILNFFLGLKTDAIYSALYAKYCVAGARRQLVKLSTKIGS